jgi:hypothetical protein
MTDSHRLTALQRIARLARVWHAAWLCLVLALPLAHALAVWHSYSHPLTEAAQDAGKHGTRLADCSLCLSAASLDHAAPAAAAMPPAVLADAPRNAPWHVTAHTATPARLNTIRGPPLPHC